MSAEAVAFVKTHSPYSNGTWWFHFIVADIVNRSHDYELWASDESLIAEWPALTKRTIEAARQQLVRDGYLTVVQRPGPGRRARWRFEFLGAEEAPPVRPVEAAEEVSTGGNARTPVRPLGSNGRNICERTVAKNASVAPPLCLMEHKVDNSKGDAPAGAGAECCPSDDPSLFPISDSTPSRATRAVAKIDEEFMEVWAQYPKRARGQSNPRAEALRAYRAARLGRPGSSAASYGELLGATVTYAAFRGRKGEDARFTMMASTFFGPGERWRDYLPDTTAPTAVFDDPDDPNWVDPLAAGDHR